MRRLILICGLLLTSYGYGAEDKQDLWEAQLEACKSGTEVAEAMMKARQRGVSLKDAYATLALFNGEDRVIYENLIKAAYSTPVMETEYASSMVSLEFSNMFFEACMGLDE